MGNDRHKVDWNRPSISAKVAAKIAHFAARNPEGLPSREEMMHMLPKLGVEESLRLDAALKESAIAAGIFTPEEVDQVRNDLEIKRQMLAAINDPDSTAEELVDFMKQMEDEKAAHEYWLDRADRADGPTA